MRVLDKIRGELKEQRSDSFRGLHICGGDILWVQYRDHIDSVRFKVYQGVCISVVESDGGQVCTLRNIIGGVGVEYKFHSLSKNIRQIKKVRDKTGKGGRVKLYNLRHSK